MTSTPAADNKGFKFGEAPEDEINSVQKIAKLDPYLIAYKDGEGKDQVRVCFHLVGTQEVFIVQSKISGANVVTPTHAWFKKKVLEAMHAQGLGLSSEATESL